ncbi:MAG: cytochrome c oxidase subunit II transmembrane domain-containing protein, partial [Limnohabitans sp.]
MKKLSQHWKKIAKASAFALAGLTTSAFATKDLPGGPAVNQLNLHVPATKLAAEQGSLHMFMMAICLVIFVVVFGVMFYSILKHRKSLGHKPAHFHESVKVEIAWTLAPFIIVIFMAIPATKTVIAQKDTSNADLTIKVT